MLQFADATEVDWYVQAATPSVVHGLLGVRLTLKTFYVLHSETKCLLQMPASAIRTFVYISPNQKLSRWSPKSLQHPYI